MVFERLISKKNLKLAWRRITTGTNHQYKRYFRDLYYPYEIAIDENIKNLHDRLKGGGGSYEPQNPIRIYMPKASGLQRPLTLLSLEDQILLQAIANLFEKKLAHRRKKLQLSCIFSNMLQGEKNSVFFLKDWHEAYRIFQEKIKEYFRDGFKWVAHFDLAAFYDTISHEPLLDMAFTKKGEDETKSRILDWFKKWSSDKTNFACRHGIPQGPIASDFLAECFLLPIDAKLSEEFRYIRYVDDIRLFAATKTDAQRAAIRLEILCRERGLIPQGKKFTITELKTISDALGALPSLTPPNAEDADQTIWLSPKQAVTGFQRALSGSPKRIQDKARARYVLYHAKPSPLLLDYVLKLMPWHPEHIDAFMYYLNHYEKSGRTVNVCIDYLNSTPYEYVQGELWHIIARMSDRKVPQSLIKEAVNVAKNRKRSFSLLWGVCHFLCRAEDHGLGKYSEFVKYQQPLLQALLVPILPDRCYAKGGITAHFLRRSSFEPGIMLAEPFTRKKLSHDTYGITEDTLPTQVQSIFRAVGITQHNNQVIVDPVGEILSHRYKVTKWKKWKLLFAGEYIHALQLLCQADPVYDSGMSRWLSYQDSFNDALFRAIQKHLNNLNLQGAMTTTDKNGKLIQFGSLMDVNKPFAKKYPVVAEAFREAHERRNFLPGSHPYATKGGARTQYLKKGERDNIAAKLFTAYSEIIKVFDVRL